MTVDLSLRLFPLDPIREVPVSEYRDFLLERGLKPKTIDLYRRMLVRAWLWCYDNGYHLSTATAANIAEYTFTTPASTSSRRHLRTALDRYWEMIGRENPPVRAVRVPPKPRGKCRALSDEQATQLKSAAVHQGGREGLAVLAGLYMGLRAHEIASMHWQRFDPGLGAYTVLGKFDQTRTVPVKAELGDMLDSVPGSHVGYLFTGSRGRPHVHPATVWGWVRDIADAAGIAHPIQTHQLRHTAISRINDRTGDLRAAQEFAGHARPETTAIYTRVNWDRLTEAVASSLDYG